jgi:hypothetical protein
MKTHTHKHTRECVRAQRFGNVGYIIRVLKEQLSVYIRTTYIYIYIRTYLKVGSSCNIVEQLSATLLVIVFIIPVRHHYTIC